MSEIKSIPVLFAKREDCCGCGACLNICPKQAITMQEDEFGFIYPVIDEDRCIRCGQCKKVCAFQNIEETNSPIECYAAVSKNPEQAKRSASAGIFAATAIKVIEQGGIVYGAAFIESWKVHHISAETMDQLCALQGSKYAQSNTESIYQNVKIQLSTGSQVLFSGTPCQVAGLYGYLKRDYDNLLTIDIICHGVPSSRMFQDYINLLGEKYSGKVENFIFRDKSIGWGINGCAIIDGKKVKLWQSASSFLYYFTQGWVYRDSCYKCPYANENRPADITLGDYWGIEKQHPELLGKNGWDESKGISCVIINTKKGKELLEHADCDIRVTTFEKIKKGNAQLTEPSKEGKRSEIFGIYKQFGWKGLQKRFDSTIGIKKYSSIIKCFLPSRLKRLLKSI